ncbi:MAG TPA: protein phosphatase 2C domain-containing protein [Pseudonocardiaceae bacterium]|jgi:serine/threonine protein phosphatase PrpC|nr:protein phosphatase 2C domain-containing protein [Pseudonocardiaceae bacterium]
MEAEPRIVSTDLPQERSEVASWTGCFEPFAVGDPGRAPDRVISKLNTRFWYRPELALDAVMVGQEGESPFAALRAASIRGLSHRHYGEVRQDEYAFRVTPDNRYLVVCVADGVSAGKWSHLAALWGSRGGVDDLCRILRDTEPEDIDWPRFVGEVAAQVEQAGRDHLLRHGVLPEDVGTTRQVAGQLATTVLYAVVCLSGSAAGQAHVYGIGDTSVWVLADGHWHPRQPIKNDGAEVYSSSVTALPLLPRELPPVIRTRVAPGQVLVLMTDGVGDPLGDGTGSVAEFLADRWCLPPSGLEFAAQVDFRRSTFDDDRTVVALWPL